MIFAANMRDIPIADQDVAAVFAAFPAPVAGKLLELRGLVFEVAAQNEEIGILQETLKWGEPSYLAKGGSTLRMAAKATDPDHYRLFFHCQTILLDTFRQIYPDTLIYEGNRAIVFDKAEVLADNDALKHCIFLALTYHRRKHLPLLGA